MIPHDKYAEVKEDLRQVANRNSLDEIFGAHDFVVADAIMFIMAMPSFSKAVNAYELAYRADLSDEDRAVYDQVFGKTNPNHADSSDELPDDAEVQE